MPAPELSAGGGGGSGGGLVGSGRSPGVNRGLVELVGDVACVLLGVLGDAVADPDEVFAAGRAGGGGGGGGGGGVGRTLRRATAGVATGAGV